MIDLNRIYCEPNLDTMARLPDNCVDAIVTDPPYGFKFMGKKWDYDVPPVEVWAECLRVLKPGGHMLAFAGTRTQHRMAVRIEDAGFEIRDMLAWVYGSGFPKSLDISKALDKHFGAEREIIGTRKLTDIRGGNYKNANGRTLDHKETSPATVEAQRWTGFGTALKPSLEPITLARKPKSGTVAENILQYGTGGLNIDACRIGERTENESGWSKSGSKESENRSMSGKNYDRAAKSEVAVGRFPANFIHDGSNEVVALFPDTKSGASKSEYIQEESENNCMSGKNYRRSMPDRAADAGSAARFFYTAKASKTDRGEHNDHPTVKPLQLMRYLCRLITPPGGIIYDPYAGSGTTLIAGIEEGFQVFGSDFEQHHCDIFQKRIRHGLQPKMF